MNSKIFESTLKRHRIYYSIKDDKIIIGSVKKDFFNYVILGIIPVISGIVLLIYLSFIVEKFHPFFIHMISALILIVGYGVLNIQRVKRKKVFNNAIKIFEKGKITIKSSNEKIEIMSADVEKVVYYCHAITKELYEGGIVIIDKNQTRHKILLLNDENKRYIKNDLKAFYDFVFNKIGIVIEE